MNYVLHIGINSYVRYAANGSSNLRGAVNDASRWRRYTAGPLRVHDSCARVLTDAAATRQGILDGLKWLREQMVADPNASGLVTYSGHGTSLAETGDGNIGLTAALCPSDISAQGDTLVNVLALADVETALGPAAANTTVIVDACYASVPDAAAPSRVLGTGAAPDVRKRVDSRLILGCEPWGQSYEMCSGGNWHGAMTFSMLTLLEQWTVKCCKGVMHANVSYGDLLYRTHQQLGVLGFAQTPLLLGEPRSAMIPFLRPGREIAAGTTSPTPDLRRPGSQLGAGDGSSGYRIYQLSASTVNGSGAGIVLATMLVAHDASGTVYLKDGFPYQFLTGSEYWWWNVVDLASVTPSTGVSITLLMDRTDWTNFAADMQGLNLTQYMGALQGGQEWAPKTLTISSNYNQMPMPDPDGGSNPLGCWWASNVPAGVNDSATAISVVMTAQDDNNQVAIQSIYWVGNASPSPEQSGFFGTMKVGDVVVFGASQNPYPSTMVWALNDYYPNGTIWGQVQHP